MTASDNVVAQLERLGGRAHRDALTELLGVHMGNRRAIDAINMANLLGRTVETPQGEILLEEGYA